MKHHSLRKRDPESVIISGVEYPFFKSKYCTWASPVYVSDGMSGKMAGIPSVSTSVLSNPICKVRRCVPGSICAHCFAVSTANHYGELANRLEDNSRLLQSIIVPRELMPEFKCNVDIVRLESFGDVANETQVENYFNLCRVNPEINFTIWTKNPELFVKPCETGTGKPRNLKIILSSRFLNIPDIEIFNKYWFLDALFTVYTPEYLKEHPETVINCGARDCNGCRNCYGDCIGCKFINEELKR